MDLRLFDALAIDTFAQGRASITARMRLQVNLIRATEMVTTESAAAGSTEIVLRPTVAATSLQGELLCGIRIFRGDTLVCVTTRTTHPSGLQITAPGELLVDVAEDDVLTLKPRSVEIICFEKRHDVDDKANARIDFRNLHLSRDEANRQRVSFEAEAVEGDLRFVREDDLFAYFENDYRLEGVVRSLKRKGRRFATIEVEVEDGEVA